MATAPCLVGEAAVRGAAVSHNAAMNDVLTYLQTQLATFDEVPFNAVDSALLAQFCMARGEGIMPQVYRAQVSGEAASPKARAGHGALGELRGLLGRLRGRAGERAGERAGHRAAKEDASTQADDPLAGPQGLGAAGTKAASMEKVAELSPVARRDRAEMTQDATAPLDPVRFADLMRAELFPTMFSGMHATSMVQQLFWMAASPRFRELLIYDHEAAFDEALDMQFAATTFVCPGQFTYVGYRGTDTTLTGWREDFNMAYMVPVPAQDLAVRYLEAVAVDRRLPERLIVGGHSKGGNLAEYAALKASPAVQERIARLYNHDGPGFMPGTFTAADYEPLAGRMTKQVPEDSMVGILMESLMPTEVVRATGRGFEQHTVYRWVVAEDGVDFATVGALPERTERRAEALAAWLASMDGEDRERMVNALFSALKAAGITDAAQLFAGGREWAILRDGVMRAPMADRTTMLNALRGLTRAFSDVTAARNNARRASKK